MNPLDLKTTALAAVFAFGLGIVGGYAVADWRLTAKANAEEVARTQAALDDLAAMTDERDRLAGKLATSNDEHQANMRKAQDETNRLRDALRAGAIGLRIAGVCPRLGETASAPGARVDIGAGTELAEPARRAYFALREALDRVGGQLAACQAELRLRTSGGNR